MTKDEMREPGGWFTGKRILILGGRSDVAKEAAREMAARGASVATAARGGAGTLPDDLRARGSKDGRFAGVDFDALSAGGVTKAWDDAEKLLGGKLDGVVYAAGILADGPELAERPPFAWEMLAVNAGAPLEVLASAGRLSEGGRCAVVTSIAGERPRKKNWAYGASKSCVSFAVEALLMRGLSNKVRLTDVRLGFCRTKMTNGMDTSGTLWTAPDVAGRMLADVVESGRSGVAYVPGFWRAITFVFRALPKFLISRMGS